MKGVIKGLEKKLENLSIRLLGKGEVPKYLSGKGKVKSVNIILDYK